MPFTATERTSPPIPLVELLAATKARVMGELDPDTEFRWIERNSREVTPGDLFIAVKGEAHDGHAFVDDAAGHGARAALVRTDWAEAHPEAPLPLISVPAPVEALQQVAAMRRQRLDIGVVGPYPPGSECAVEVRAFCPSIGVVEDPVTGSLNASIAQWLAGDRLPTSYVAAQGTALGRRGRVHISVEGGTVWVGGDASTTVSGQVDL